MAETFGMGTVENFRWERGDMVANRLSIQFKIRGGDPIVVIVCSEATRRACAARVTVVVLCVSVCVQAAHLRHTQLSDKLDILTDSVSWWLQI